MDNIVTNNILQYIDNINVSNNNIKEKYFDCVISGGGLKGYYNFGICKILKKMDDCCLINIRKYTCVSAGAIIMTYIMCNIPIIHSINIYNELKTNNNNNNNLHENVINVMNDILPENAHILCSDKIYIVLSKLTCYGFQKEIVTNFYSKQHLIDVLSASIFIPFITSTGWQGILIGEHYYFDGWFVGNIPVNINNDIPQLVIETHNVNYDSNHILTMTDVCPELLIIKGAIEMEHFLNNKHVDILPIKWYEKTNKKFDWYFFIPFIMFGIAYFYF
jgi:hypothetical protein